MATAPRAAGRDPNFDTVGHLSPLETGCLAENYPDAGRVTLCVLFRWETERCAEPARALLGQSTLEMPGTRVSACPAAKQTATPAAATRTNLISGASATHANSTMTEVSTSGWMK